jgi:uncharacterized protein YwgA
MCDGKLKPVTESAGKLQNKCDGKRKTVSTSVLVSLQTAVNWEVNTNGKAHGKLITLQIVMYIYEPEHNKGSLFMVCIKEQYNFKCFGWYSQQLHNKQVHICICMYPL